LSLFSPFSFSPSFLPSGGDYLVSNKSKPAVIFVDDPKPQLIKVREEYHLRRRLRRKNWPKYECMYGWLSKGEIEGDIIMRYHTGDLYDGPYVHERWLDVMGNCVEQGRTYDHWGGEFTFFRSSLSSPFFLYLSTSLFAYTHSFLHH
jgi:hypothetical protein